MLYTDPRNIIHGDNKNGVSLIIAGELYLFFSGESYASYTPHLFLPEFMKYVLS